MKFRWILLCLFLLGEISLSTSCSSPESTPEEAREADGLDKLIDAAREDRDRGLRELDVTKPLPEFIKDGPYEVAVDLGLAFHVDHVSLLEVLLREHDVNETDEDGDSLLHRAASRGATGCTTLLLERGAELEARNKYGATALLEAIDARSAATADILLSHGADPNVATSTGSSALGVAARWDLAEITRRLLVAGARVEGPAADFQAFHNALGFGSMEVMPILKKAGGVPPLRASELAEELGDQVGRGNTAGVAILLEMGADPRAENEAGISALAIAEIMNEERPGSAQDMLELLVNSANTESR